jgi:hypothetical protein
LSESTDSSLPQRSGFSFHWRTLPECDVRVEHPLLRQPISLIIDDPAPDYNPAYFHLGFRHGPMHTGRALVDRFADLVESTGARGKFSVIPYPFGLGRVDRAVQGVSQADLTYFLDVVRARIAPRMDITPEALTHWNALDLATGQLLPLWEHVWSREQNRQSLLPHMVLGLEILDNVGLPCTGFTSPWNYGDGVEEEMAEAILAAQQARHGRSLTWYFLHSRTDAHVPPRLTILRPERAEAVVSIEACDPHDFGVRLWTGGEADLDMLISADGQSGRLAEVVRAGGPAVLHTHWQTMFAQGSLRGLPALAEVIRRLGEHFGERLLWTGCDDLAHYAAAAASLQVERREDEREGRTFRLISPFSASHFTISLGGAGAVRDVRTADGEPLTRVQSSAGLREGTYHLEDGRLYVCLALSGNQLLEVS